MNKIRIITLFVFLGIFTGIFQLGSMSTVSEEEAALFMEEFEKLVLDIDAFKILDDITDVKQLEKIIKEIVKEKTRQKEFQINQNDLETYLGIKDDPNLQNEMKILSDPTSKITSGEGVKGYNALFSSRFNKLKRIVSDRPESKMIKSIAIVKTTKLENDVYVCGLLTTRNAERNVTKLVLEDPSGSLEGIIFDEELQ